MSDVLSKILGSVLGGGQMGGQRGGQMGGGLGLPQDEAGRLGGSQSGMGGGLGGGLGGLLGGGGMGGGLGALLGGLLGGGRGAGMGGGLGGGMGGGMGGALGGLAGGMGGMKGVALTALLAYMMRGQGGAQGLSSLTDNLRGAGLGNHVDSWVSNGPNQQIAPDELARAIPPDALAEVEQHTGLGRDELLSDLSRGLPGMVNHLTPQGRLPERDDELNDHDENDVLSHLGLGQTRRG